LYICNLKLLAYTNYENVRETTRGKIPFGIAQIGKAFCNEISSVI